MSSFPRVAYCLACDGVGTYEAMARVSLATIRVSNPNTIIEVVCDRHTFAKLRSDNSKLFSEADFIHCIETPNGTPTFRSRYIKTQVGLLIKGSFLFLDTDVIVRDSLDPLLEISADISAAPNHSRDNLAGQIWIEDAASLDSMGWPTKDVYFNTGVILFSGTKASVAFSKAWHSNWLLNFRKTKRAKDQPSFNYTLIELGTPIHKLDHRWNAQVQGAPIVAMNAAIWHLYMQWNDETLFEFKRQLVYHSHNYSLLNPREVAERLLSKPHPWCSRSMIDDWVATKAIKMNYMSANTRIWLNSNPLEYAFQMAQLSIHYLRKLFTLRIRPRH